MLKFVHHRFVLERPDLALHQRGQARLLGALVEALHAWLVDPSEAVRLPRRLHDLVEMAFAEVRGLTAADYGLPDSAVLVPASMARGRAIVDFVAALTDGQAAGLLDALSGRSRQLWTDAFVL